MTEGRDTSALSQLSLEALHMIDWLELYEQEHEQVTPDDLAALQGLRTRLEAFLDER
jgi:hypothetical protein